MADFLSDEEMNKLDQSAPQAAQSPDFISDDEMHKIGAPPADSGAMTAAANHLIQGATGGFSDELVGLGEAGGRALGLEGVGSRSPGDISMSQDGPTLDWQTLRDAYRMARDKDRGALKAQSENHPYASGTGSVAGMVMSPLNKLGGGLSMAKQGAALGGLNALGASDADLTKGEVGQSAIDTGLGVGTGAVLGKGLERAAPYVDKGISYAGDKLGDLADRFAARALGAERGTIKSLGFDKVKAAGRQALDEGILSPLANTDDLIARNEALKSRGGEMMGEAYKAIDDAGASTFNPHLVANDVEKELGGFYRSPLNRGETSQFNNTIDAIKMRAPGMGDYAIDAPVNNTIPLTQAQSLKEELGRAANWKNKLTVTPKEQLAREAYGIVSKSIDDAVEKGSGAIQSAGLSDVLSQGKNLYSKASTADQLLNNKQAREQGNKILGLTDWGVLGAGAAAAPLTGGASIPATIAVEATKKGLEKYGAQNAALGLDKISKSLMSSPGMAALAQKSPEVFAQIARKMADKVKPESEGKSIEPEALIQKVQGTKYAGVLQNAAKRGGSAVGATHFILSSTDPDYRKAMNKENEELEP